MEEAKRMCIQSQFIAGSYCQSASHTERAITSLVQDTGFVGGGEASAILSGEFITTSEESHSLDSRVSVNMLREADNALEAQTHFLAVLCSQDDGLLQDNMVARLGQSQGADREYEDGEVGYLELFHIRDNCDRVLRPVISPLIIWHSV